jgi:CheY-like chemotaxis protein
MHEYKNKSILLVEDETIIALTQSAVLKKSGFNVKSVLSGEKAVALLESGETFDLILMDIDLGKGMSGTEAAEKILSMCDIPILFLSSHTEPEIVEKTEGITSYGYVVKNSGDTVLLASIRMAFRLFEEKVKVQRHKEQFQKLNEELEATNEELTAAMEELEAANEELLQSQGEILLSEEKFRRLFMSSNDGICLHEIIYNEKGDAADYRIIDVNPVYEDITGLKRIDVAGKSASGVYGTGAPPYLDVYS